VANKIDGICFFCFFYCQPRCSSVGAPDWDQPRDPLWCGFFRLNHSRIIKSGPPPRQILLLHCGSADVSNVLPGPVFFGPPGPEKFRLEINYSGTRGVCAPAATIMSPQRVFFASPDQEPMAAPAKWGEFLSTPLRLALDGFCGDNCHASTGLNSGEFQRPVMKGSPSTRSVGPRGVRIQLSPSAGPPSHSGQTPPISNANKKTELSAYSNRNIVPKPPLFFPFASLSFVYLPLLFSGVFSRKFVRHDL